MAIDTLLQGLPTTATHVPAESDNGYTTNMHMADLTGRRAWVVDTYSGQPLAPEHGGPARLLVPHLYFWKSAKWVTRLRLGHYDQPGSDAPPRVVFSVAGPGGNTRIVLDVAHRW